MLSRLLAGGIAVWVGAAPASAFELGRPYGHIGLDASFEDHVTGKDAPDPRLYPRGNNDGTGGLSMGVGEELAFTDDWILTLSGRLKGYRYVNYPDFSGVGGTLVAEMAAYHLVGPTDAFWTWNAGATYGTGGSGGTDLTFERPLLLDVVGSSDIGVYRYSGSGSDHTGVWGELALRRHFGPLSVSLAYTYSHRGYDAGMIDQLQGASLYASVKVLDGLYVKASVEHDWTGSTDPTRAYQENLANLGSLYYLF